MADEARRDVVWRVAHAVAGRLRLSPVGAPPRDAVAVMATRLRAVRGVRSVTVRPRTGSLIVTWPPGSDTGRAVRAALSGVPGGRTAPGPAAPPRAARRVAVHPRPTAGFTADWPVVRSSLGLLSATAAFGLSLLPLPGAVPATLLIVAGLPTLARAGRSLRRERRLTVDSLDAVALVLLVVRGQYRPASLLTGLLWGGQWVLDQTVRRTRASVRELFGTGRQAVRRLQGRRRDRVPAEALRPGDTLVLGAGERVPVDGHVVRGEALVDQHTMTGESLPVERRAQDRVHAGTTVEDGEIVVRVERVGAETGLGRIIGAIERAEGEKAELQVVGERLADRLVGRTFLLAGAGALVARSVDAGVSILVADYGTPVRVAVPTAAMVAIRRGLAHGILVKGPRVLERLARVDTVVFDKTGTLTWGVPAVSRVAIVDPALSAERLVGLAAAAERDVRHPVARSIVRHAARLAVPVPVGSGPEARIGLGTAAVVEGLQVLVGGRRFMEVRGVAVDAASDEEAAALAIGASPVFVGVDGKLAGVFVIQDDLRADARRAVEALRRRQVRDVIMLSGDHPEPTREIAERLAIERHHAEFLPEDKARLIRTLRAEGRVVAMVGDGVNDALALREADVGVAVQGGVEVVTEAAGVVLLRGGLDGVVQSLELGRHAVETFRRTLAIATRANVVTVGLVSFGLLAPTGAILLSNGAAVAAALYARTRPGPAGDHGRRDVVTES